jgi:glycosyltransferase involved in cell wall biosynthesis
VTVSPEAGDLKAPTVLFVMPATSLHGGNRIVFELADELTARGYAVTVASPEGPPDWHQLEARYLQLPIDRPGVLPLAEIAIGTYYPTVPVAFGSGASHVFHLCQGFEGEHREFAHRLSAIDAAYSLPIAKLVVSQHLSLILEQRYGARCHLIGQAIDQRVFRPQDSPSRGNESELQPGPRPLRIGVVGPYGIRPKGVHEALEGLRQARAAGHELEVFRASSEPFSAEEQALGVTDHFFSRLPTREMPSFYHRLDVLIHPTHDEEGFGLPALEAMACGVAVAMTDIRPLAILPADAAIRFAPGRPEALVPVIALLSDPERRRALSAAGRRASADYTFTRMVDRLEAAFAAEGAPTRARRLNARSEPDQSWELQKR